MASKPWLQSLSRWSVELLVVFVGVWLSLLAEDWRQARLDAETERESLARIAEDLDSDLEDLRFNLARAQVGIDAGRQIEEWAAAGEADGDALARALTAIQFCSMFVENAAEYVALRNSGNLGILSDVELRGRIVSGYESRIFLRFMHADDCTRTEDVVDLMMPHATLEAPGEASRIANTWSSDGLPDTSRPRVTRIEEPRALLSSPRFHQRRHDAGRPALLPRPADRGHHRLGQDFAGRPPGSALRPKMVYMIVETFRGGAAAPVYRRVREDGRGFPEGVVYRGSWVSSDLTRCFQLMECEDRERLDAWLASWSDLVEFEVVPVISSEEAAARALEGGDPPS